jgi:heme/copper-type cytochrome/quinol oxidase subunit 2
MVENNKSADIYEFIFTTYAILILFIIIILCFNNFYNLLIFLRDNDENIIRNTEYNDKKIIKDLFGFKIVNYYINKAEYNKYPNTYCDLSLDINETILQFFTIISILITIIVALLFIIQSISRNVNNYQSYLDRFQSWNNYRSFAVLVILSIILLFIIIIYRISYKSEVNELIKNIKSLYIYNEKDISNDFLHNKIRHDFDNLDEITRAKVKLSLETMSKYNIEKNKTDIFFLNNLYDLCEKLYHEDIKYDFYKTFSKIINNYDKNTDNKEKKYDFFKDILAIDFNNETYNNKDDDIIILSSLLQAKYLDENDENDEKDDYIIILKNEVGNEKTENKIKLMNIMKSSKRIVFNDIILIFIITFILIFCFIILSLTLYYNKKDNINCFPKYENSSIIWTLDYRKSIYIKICDIVNIIFKYIKKIL